MESSSQAEATEKRCIALCDRILRSAIQPKVTLLRLINSELSFLHRITASNRVPSAHSFNVGHIEAVVHVLLQPAVTGVSRICKSIRLSPSRTIYADIVCSLNGSPVWILVSDKNPRHILWEAQPSSKDKGLKNKLQQVLDAASESPLALRPASVVLFFSNGLRDDVYQKIQTEFGSTDLEMDLVSYDEVELENEWTNVVLGRSFTGSCVVEIKVEKNVRGMTENNLMKFSGIDIPLTCNRGEEDECSNLGKSFYSLIHGMKCWCCSLDADMEVELGFLKDSESDGNTKLVNFDTTSMIAVVSGISNGEAGSLLATQESQMKDRFKGNYEFVFAQVNSEIQNPIHHELSVVTSGKRGILCESVYSEFQELVSMYGGPNEKLRAKCFLKILKVVPDCLSARLASLSTTRKLALKNKVVFGTGDHWKALTVTANKAFVRAVSQTGMPLFVFEHRPRALVGS